MRAPLSAACDVMYSNVPVACEARSDELTGIGKGFVSPDLARGSRQSVTSRQLEAGGHATSDQRHVIEHVEMLRAHHALALGGHGVLQKSLPQIRMLRL